MSEKIYCGKGKASKFGVKINLNLSKLPKEHIREFNGEKYITLELLEMRKPDDKGNTHYAIVDTWKPTPKAPQTDEVELKSGDAEGNELPF